MAQAIKVKKQTPEEKNEQLLAEIVALDVELTERKAILNQVQERRDFLLQEAVDRKIERAGNFKLVRKERVTRKVDMLAIEEMLTQPQFMEIAHCSLKDAEKFLTKQQIEKVTSKTITAYYRVQEIYKPVGC
jgi:hypothetical protein